MRITLEVPDELARALTPDGQEPTRAAIEGWAVEAYRQHRLTAYQLRTLLGIPSRWDLDAFLKTHEVYDYTLKEFEEDLASIGAARELNPAR
ncbi:MAG: UPF0175 family protein [Acidobacteriaceae bacterium]|nr:UPF0175 family protein [Acidobacteriaceae bacterium]MBV9295208.1 UPF0175 family protein [Acidobacteriaceae bacterium]MBV9767499.1 UPF0175 family protein [Acidobacteriaceae bacterium]